MRRRGQQNAGRIGNDRLRTRELREFGGGRPHYLAAVRQIGNYHRSASLDVLETKAALKDREPVQQIERRLNLVERYGRAKASGGWRRRIATYRLSNAPHLGIREWRCAARPVFDE